MTIMKTLLAAVVLVSLIAVINCQAGSPQCIADYYTNNPDVVLRAAQDCEHLFDDVRI